MTTLIEVCIFMVTFAFCIYLTNIDPITVIDIIRNADIYDMWLISFKLSIILSIVSCAVSNIVRSINQMK